MVHNNVMSRIKPFVTTGWALSSDGIQWILQKRKGNAWEGLSYVRSTKEILARCMREKEVPPEDQRRLLANLPETFDEWNKVVNEKSKC
jgi:hypothetical protein